MHKILFFSDLHLGQHHRFSKVTDIVDGNKYSTRGKEHMIVCDDVIRLIDEENITRLVFGGDFFTTVGNKIDGNDLILAKDFLDKIQTKCIEKNIHFDIIVGNHDKMEKDQDFGKLYCFRGMQNITIYDRPVEIGNYVYMPYCINDEMAADFLKGIENKENKIVFSHLEISGINLGEGIFTQKGVSLDLLKQFKMVLQGHYHNGTSLGPNIKVAGCTQRLSFKDKGRSRKNGIVYDEKTNKVKKIDFTCPDWLVYNDDNLDDFLNVDNNNYIRLELSTDLLLTPEIQAKLEEVKGKEVHIDLNRISINKTIDDKLDSVDESDVIVQFVNSSDNTTEQKSLLIKKGTELLNKVKDA